MWGWYAAFMCILLVPLEQHAPSWATASRLGHAGLLAEPMPNADCQFMPILCCFLTYIYHGVVEIYISSVVLQSILHQFHNIKFLELLGGPRSSSVFASLLQITCANTR